MSPHTSTLGSLGEYTKNRSIDNFSPCTQETQQLVKKHVPITTGINIVNNVSL